MIPSPLGTRTLNNADFLHESMDPSTDREKNLPLLPHYHHRVCNHRVSNQTVQEAVCCN